MIAKNTYINCCKVKCFLLRIATLNVYVYTPNRNYYAAYD